ncbi:MULTISPECIES: M28 family peptidase [Bizionia]|uniref:Carboxypeptidase Q n=1 Tax=Bizionia algoritergicola TaxID=291187 RepID=A0A5D0R126_9FLAO|nr:MULTISPECIES: M28 family peptidase [Bizionia]OBX24267.1 peptidase M28 [Bizionia sp. APA-3]TYB75187.1 M28 family peptidase [Bizionia algoritergicola]
MIKKILFLCVFSVAFSSLTQAQSIKKQTTKESLEQTVITDFSGDLAYETTAFVEKYWRVVGNTGFNESINFIAKNLESAGFVLEEKSKPNNRLTYRIEKRPLKNPTWEMVDALVTFNSKEAPLLAHKTNRNMVALNSFSTPKEGVTAEVIYVEDVQKLKKMDVNGKIIFAETSPSRIYNDAIVKGGAIGLMTYDNPSYLQPEKNTTSIQFRSIPLNSKLKPWAIALSYQAKERLKEALSKGPITLNVQIETKIYESEELTIVADIKGNKLPNERLVFSAHVQEPGANDNATGVGVALEMATLSAKLLKDNTWNPTRTLTFLWGDEIVSTGRYVQEDKTRAQDIKWGISLDMVGENTDITGGSFLIEKMPDPSAIWTRGNDKHSEWGGSKMSLDQMKPHYLNDFVIGEFEAQGKRANWEVNTNPFEGGSDHMPFLRSNIPSVLFWHFTDQFYHTDNDRLDKVSKETLKNVGTASLLSAYILLNSDATTAKTIIANIETAAISRLHEELKQGKIAIKKGDKLAEQIEIIKAWEDWYVKAIATTVDMSPEATSLKEAIEKAQASVRATSEAALLELSK